LIDIRTESAHQISRFVLLKEIQVIQDKFPIKVIPHVDCQKFFQKMEDNVPEVIEKGQKDNYDSKLFHAVSELI
jgi:hypothetical protein